MRLLIVDDDEVDRLAVIRALTNSGMHGEFREASTVEDARRLIGEQRPDCVLLDFCMPGQDGVSFLETLSSDSPEGEIGFPIILLTGLGDERLAVRALRAGAVDYVPKDEVGTKTLPNAVFRAVHQSEDISRLRARRKRNAEWARKARRRHRSVVDLWADSLTTIDQEVQRLRTLLADDRNDETETRAALARLEAATNESRKQQTALSRRPRHTLVDTRRLLEEVREDLERDGALNGTQISFGVLPSVSADTEVLRRTFSDLFRGAVASGSPRIRVEASRACRGWSFSLVRDPVAPQANGTIEPGSPLRPTLLTLRALLSTVGGDLRHENGDGQSATFVFLPDSVRVTT